MQRHLPQRYLLQRYLLLLAAGAAFAANEMNGPSLGWMWDRDSKALRRLSGLPGALRNESGIDLGDGVRAVWIAPAQNVVLIARDGGRLVRRNLVTDETTSLEADMPEVVVFSPDGRQIGLWSKSAERFALWGEPAQDLSAARIALSNDGELVILDSDGLLRSSRGASLGNFGANGAIALDGTRLVAVGSGALAVYEKNSAGWRLASRREDDRFDALRQLELESDSVLAVTRTGSVDRWPLSGGDPETLAADGVSALTRLRQPGFYLAEGESTRVFFALGASQRLYSMPNGELR